MPLPRKSVLLSALLATLPLVAAGVVQAEEGSFALLPTRIALASREARQTLVVQRRAGEQFQEQGPAGEVKLQSSDEMVVRIEEGVAMPVANGSATIPATVGDQTAMAEVI